MNTNIAVTMLTGSLLAGITGSASAQSFACIRDAYDEQYTVLRRMGNNARNP